MDVITIAIIDRIEKAKLLKIHLNKRVSEKTLLIFSRVGLLGKIVGGQVNQATNRHAQCNREIQQLNQSHPPYICTGGGCNILHWQLLSAINAVICMALGPSYVRYFSQPSCCIFACLVPGFIVCLVSSCRYNGLATLALAGPSGPLRALRARRAGPSGPHAAKTFKRSLPIDRK